MSAEYHSLIAAEGLAITYREPDPLSPDFDPAWLFRGAELPNAFRQPSDGLFGLLESVQAPPPVSDPKTTGWNYTVEYVLNPSLLFRFVYVYFPLIYPDLRIPDREPKTSQTNLTLLEGLVRPTPSIMTVSHPSRNLNQ